MLQKKVLVQSWESEISLTTDDSLACGSGCCEVSTSGDGHRWHDRDCGIALDEVSEIVRAAIMLVSRCRWAPRSIIRKS